MIILEEVLQSVENILINKSSSSVVVILWYNHFQITGYRSEIVEKNL